MVELALWEVVEPRCATVLRALLVLIARLWSQLARVLLIVVTARALRHSRVSVQQAGLERHATSLCVQGMWKTSRPTATATECARQTRHLCARVALAGRGPIVQRASAWQTTARTVGHAQPQGPV